MKNSDPNTNPPAFKSAFDQDQLSRKSIHLSIWPCDILKDHYGHIPLKEKPRRGKSTQMSSHIIYICFLQKFRNKNSPALKAFTPTRLTKFWPSPQFRQQKLPGMEPHPCKWEFYHYQSHIGYRPKICFRFCSSFLIRPFKQSLLKSYKMQNKIN